MVIGRTEGMEQGKHSDGKTEIRFREKIAKMVTCIERMVVENLCPIELELKGLRVLLHYFICFSLMYT